MSRYGAQYGPDVTFLGVDIVEVSPPYDSADVPALPLLEGREQLS